MVISPRLTKWVKWVGYPLFALFCFIVSVYLTFPFERVKGLIEAEAGRSGKMRVSIGDVGASPLLGVKLSDVRVTLLPRAPLRMRGLPGAPPPPPPKPTTVVVDAVRVNSGLWALISGGIDIDFEVEGLGGEIEGAYEASKKEGWSLEAEADGVRLQDIPQIVAAVGLPVRGQVTGAVMLSVPHNRWAEASGAVTLTCADCSVGDGKAKLKVPGNPFLAQGITLPRIRLGRFGGQIKVEKGVAIFDNVSAKSPDIEVHLEGKINLRQPVAFSTVDGYLRFRISPDLKKRDAKFELLENGLSNAKRPDGFYGMRLSGTLKNLRPVPSRVGPGGAGGRRFGDVAPKSGRPPQG